MLWHEVLAFIVALDIGRRIWFCRHEMQSDAAMKLGVMFGFTYAVLRLFEVLAGGSVTITFKNEMIESVWIIRNGLELAVTCTLDLFLAVHLPGAIKREALRVQMATEQFNHEHEIEAK